MRGVLCRRTVDSPRRLHDHRRRLAVGAAIAVCASLTGCAAAGGGHWGNAAGSGMMPPAVSTDASGGGDESGMMPPTVSTDASGGGDETEVARLIRDAKLPPCPASTPAVPVPHGLPRLTLPCLGTGPDVTLSGLRGTPLVLNVWASWCPPCAQEKPHLLAARRALAGQVSFLGIDLVDRRTAALAWAKDFGMTFPSVQDPDGLIRAELNVPAPPVTILVRPDGRIAKIHYGAFTSGPDVRDAIAANLGVRP